MALSEIAPLSDTPATVFAKLNAAIDAVNALQQQVLQVAETAYEQIVSSIDNETSRAERAEGSLTQAIINAVGDETNRAETAESAETSRAEGVEAGLDQRLSSEVDARHERRPVVPNAARHRTSPTRRVPALARRSSSPV